MANLDRANTILVQALAKDNENEAFAAFRALRKLKIDYHSVRLSETKTSVDNDVDDYWIRRHESDQRLMREMLDRTHRLKAELIVAHADIAKLKDFRRGTRAKVLTTNEWVTRLKYTELQAKAEKARIDQAYSAGLMTFAARSKRMAHVTRRTSKS